LVGAGGLAVHAAERNPPAVLDHIVGGDLFNVVSMNVDDDLFPWTTMTATTAQTIAPALAGALPQQCTRLRPTTKYNRRPTGERGKSLIGTTPSQARFGATAAISVTVVKGKTITAKAATRIRVPDETAANQERTSLCWRIAISSFEGLAAKHYLKLGDEAP